MANRHLISCFPGSFQSSHGEKHHYTKSSQEVNPDKPGCATSCHEVKLTQNFGCVFSGFWSPIPDFCNQPKSCRVGCRVCSSGTLPLPMSNQNYTGAMVLFKAMVILGIGDCSELNSRQKRLMRLKTLP